ncbi:unnamed protein product, partial [Discosporangium mesarthrocarpum]
MNIGRSYSKRSKRQPSPLVLTKGTSGPSSGPLDNGAGHANNGSGDYVCGRSGGRPAQLQLDRVAARAGQQRDGTDSNETSAQPHQLAHHTWIQAQGRDKQPQGKSITSQGQSDQGKARLTNRVSGAQSQGIGQPQGRVHMPQGGRGDVRERERVSQGEAGGGRSRAPPKQHYRQQVEG